MNIHLFSYKCLLFQTGESHSEKINENKCFKIPCFCHYFINLKPCSYTCDVNKYYRRAQRKARKSNIWEFYQLVSSHENGENSLELPIILYEILFFFKNEQLLF